MDQAALATLRELGQQLDRHVFPNVFVGGIVRPRKAADLSQPLGQENGNDRQGQEGSPTRSRQRPARRQGQAGGTRPSGASTPVVVGSPREAYQRQLTTICGAYPGSQFWAQDDGLWLLARSNVLEGLDRHAVFLVAIPDDFGGIVQAWGFWSRGNIGFATWIGPRHTNFPHGSICAFNPADGTWKNGDALRLLLDMYSLWAARQLYLEAFGRWPGAQIARWRYERLVETHPDELCGCGSLEKSYAECCRPKDLQANCVADAIRYLRDTGGGERRPPPELLQFLRTPSSPPPIPSYCSLMR